MRRFSYAILGCSMPFVFLGCGGGEPTPIEIGDAAPLFSLPIVGHASARLASDQLKGKITVLNFWSTTCSVCLKETEDLGQVYKSGKANVIGIALEEDADNVARLVKDRAIKYPVVLGDEAVFARFNGYAIPYTVVLDRSLLVRKRVYGRIEADELAKVIEEIDRSPLALGSREQAPVIP